MICTAARTTTTSTGADRVEGIDWAEGHPLSKLHKPVLRARRLPGRALLDLSFLHFLCLRLGEPDQQSSHALPPVPHAPLKGLKLGRAKLTGCFCRSRSNRACRWCPTPAPATSVGPNQPRMDRLEAATCGCTPRGDGIGRLSPVRHSSGSWAKKLSMSVVVGSSAPPSPVSRTSSA